MNNVCPSCNQEYSERPALSRVDNMTKICPECGMKEAIEVFNQYLLHKEEGWSNMRGFPNKETVERVREQYPVGCRVELLRMDDPLAPPIGTKGIVSGVDDIASIMVDWDNGSSLQVVYGEDICRKII